jgi:large subunit ribosomal protein L15e
MVQVNVCFVREAWKKPDKSDVEALLWDRMQVWRREGSVVRVEHPTRIDRARRLVTAQSRALAVARVKVRRGGRRRSRYIRARRSARMGKNRLTSRKEPPGIAEERAVTRFPNMEVLNFVLGRAGRQAEVL